ncbi:hypothetical protein DOTSEDRAFT_172151 [Dothistroma septosporum NZE10]|uniref:U6 snRNA phosphodiesterase n=1 Tax=Dothistroma septosporum (strain NZE10 / CBS 128990) TaxID=675120 RepID=N1PKW7_DOTSN|nr:hypothetical protein DOTSEDRAFT_172151 [Dothistroma septosporum NZE10]
MGLVDYSDSDEDAHQSPASPRPPAKKRKTLGDEKDAAALPPLPASFRDLYSSTVRTSTQDDPSLHAGRKRVVPHIAGNWPTHVYLEWFPEAEAYNVLCLALRDVQHSLEHGVDNVHSLLQNHLGVQLPLHVSLSRSLALKTEQKDSFLTDLEQAVASTAVRTFSVSPTQLIWHPNEDRTRWFLVLKLQRPAGDELQKMLGGCNELAARFDQPLLYQTTDPGSAEGKFKATSIPVKAFHISVAWSLQPPIAQQPPDHGGLQQAISSSILEQMGKLKITFEGVKIRIGQDVTSVQLQKARITAPTT